MKTSPSILGGFFILRGSATVITKHIQTPTLLQFHDISKEHLNLGHTLWQQD